MKTAIFLFTFLGAVSAFAQDKTAPKPADQATSHVQMHEQMAKAHQQAADCLKAGKSEEECRKAFREMCGDAGGQGKCGHWMIGDRKGKKGKSP